MISVESHSKQIKLLNQYILALERQVGSAKKQLEEVQRTSKGNAEEIKRINDEGLRVKNENQQLKKQFGKLGEQLHRFQGLEKEYFGLRDYLNKQLEEKNGLIANIQEITHNNQTLYERMQELQAEISNKTTQYQSEKKKWKEDLDRVKQQSAAKDRRYNELANQYNSEKDKYVAKTNSLEGNLNTLLKFKNEQIGQLKIQLEQAKSQINNQVNEANSQRSYQNDTIKNITIKFNEAKAEIERLQKQNGELKSQLDKKLNQLGVISANFNSKIKDYDVYVKRTNEEKSNLLRILRSVEDQKRNIQAVNASFKGDVNETNRNLSINLKKVQELTQILTSTQTEVSELKNYKLEADSLIAGLKKEKVNLQSELAKVSKERDQASQRQNQVLRIKYNSEIFYNNQINKKQEEISRLNQQIQVLNGMVKEKVKNITKLQEQLRDVTQEYNSFKNQSYSFKEGQSSELQQLLGRLKESQRKNSALLDKIDHLTGELKALELRYNNQKNNLYLTKVQLEKEMQSHSKEIQESTHVFEFKLSKKNEEIALITTERQNLLAKLKTAQANIIALREEKAASDKLYRQQLKRLGLERDSHKQQINTITLSSLIQIQKKNSKESQAENLNRNIQILQDSLKQQKNTIDLLTRSVAQKQKEIQGLEQSNTALRKQIISSIKNQQASKMQLIQVKSRSGSILGGSRVRSSYFQGASSGKSFADPQNRIPKHVRINEIVNNIRSGSWQKRSFNKKRTAPAPRQSMIQEISGANLEVEETVEEISKIID